VARVYNGFSNYRLFAGGYQAAAGLCAGLAEAAGRRFERLWPTSTNDLRDSENRWSRQSVSRHLPGSLFDPRYEGLTAHAASLDAAVCRRVRVDSCESARSGHVAALNRLWDVAAVPEDP
jgi:hypothetical protein